MTTLPSWFTPLQTRPSQSLDPANEASAKPGAIQSFEDQARHSGGGAGKARTTNARKAPYRHRGPHNPRCRLRNTALSPVAPRLSPRRHLHQTAAARGTRSTSTTSHSTCPYLFDSAQRAPRRHARDRRVRDTRACRDHSRSKSAK